MTGGYKKASAVVLLCLYGTLVSSMQGLPFSKELGLVAFIR
jgi:hypothetical protein